MKKYLVRLEAEERGRLEQLVRVGKAAAYRIRHANILPVVDESEAGPKLKDAQAAEAWGVAVPVRGVCADRGAAVDREDRGGAHAQAR